jgi:F-type H+-transporting ATPase subunit a
LWRSILSCLWVLYAYCVTKLSIDTVRFRARRKYVKWVPFLGTIFLFCIKWSGALIPWHFWNPKWRISCTTNDINTTVALSLTSIAYFYAGISKRIRLLQTLCFTSRVLLPINVLEDFTKPLSLSFRLFGNILADELVVGVLVALYH